MPIDHEWIAQRIPHHGAMCLLDRVFRWDDSTIVCAANNHRQPDHPLRAHGRLSATCGIEYAAQAMAVHGALLAGDGPDPAPRIGMLASVRGIAMHVARLDDIDGELSIEARRVAGDRSAIAYEFSLRAGERALLSGRATVILDASPAGEGR